MNFNISYFCDQGTPLKENQDRVLVNGAIIAEGICHLCGAQKACCFVADGIGSLMNSAMAAQFVLDGIALLGMDFEQDMLIETIKSLNTSLIRLNLNNPEYYDSGTTLCGIVINDDELYTLNVGDSEVFVLRDGILTRITDHQVLDDFAANSPLISYLGTTRDYMDLEVGTRYSRYQPGDLIIVTTDGLMKVFSTKELISILTSALTLRDKVENVYHNLKQQSVPDNLGVIFIWGESQ